VREVDFAVTIDLAALSVECAGVDGPDVRGARQRMCHELGR